MCFRSCSKTLDCRIWLRVPRDEKIEINKNMKKKKKKWTGWMFCPRAPLPKMRSCAQGR